MLIMTTRPLAYRPAAIGNIIGHKISIELDSLKGWWHGILVSILHNPASSQWRRPSQEGSQWGKPHIYPHNPTVKIKVSECSTLVRGPLTLDLLPQEHFIVICGNDSAKLICSQSEQGVYARIGPANTPLSRLYRLVKYRPGRGLGQRHAVPATEPEATSSPLIALSLL